MLVGRIDYVDSSREVYTVELWRLQARLELSTS